VRARRKDANHADVLDFLRAEGWSVLDLAKYGAPCDAVVGRPGIAVIVEVKDGAKPPSARKLTAEGQKLWDSFEGPKIIATSPEDAAAKLLALTERSF